MKKILFLHGFFATGSCPMARALKEAFEGTAVMLTPDLPLHPKEALKEIRSIIDREQPDLLLGNSCGSFLAQMLAPVVGIPALLGNPYFMMTEFLKERIGEHCGFIICHKHLPPVFGHEKWGSTFQSSPRGKFLLSPP